MGCDDDPVSDDPPDPEPDPDPSVTASFTIDPDDPEVGDEVTLDGSDSSVENADDLSFDWTLTPPSGSGADVADSEAEVTTFTADVEGDYDVTLDVSANGATDSASGSVTAIETTDTEEISSDISSDRTLSAETLYRVTDAVTIDAFVTVEPGTRIEFERGAGFAIDSDGALNAEGTEEEPIQFTGTDEEPGFWLGLYFRNSESPENVLDWVLVEHAGREAVGSGNEAANVTVARSRRDAQVSITNTTLRGSGGYGLFVNSNGTLADFEGNSITENAEAPISIAATEMAKLDAGSILSGNGTDAVEVRGSDTNIPGSTWSALDVPYQMSGETQVRGDDTELTVEPGAEFQFERGAQLSFRDESTSFIEGTQDEPILFTGVEEEPGFWNGLYYRDTDNPDNTLDWVVVEHAGREAVGSGNEAANVTVARSRRSAQVSITNTTLRGSGGYGLFVNSGGEVNEDVLEVNDFEDNADGDAAGDGMP